MRRAAPILAWAVGIVVGVVAVALLAANLYVQSQGTQARLQQELSQRLGVPLRVQQISVTPWGGLKLSGITIPQSNPALTDPFLQAGSFRLRVRLSSLLQRQLAIKEVALIKPQVVWAQNASGKWRLPSRSDYHLPPEEAGRRGLRAGHGLAVQSAVKQLKLVDGSFHFLDRQGRTVARIENVRFSSAVREGSELNGEARIGKIMFHDGVTLTNVHSGLHYDPTALELSGLNAGIARGELTGDFSMQPQLEDSPFQVHASFQRVQADELVTQAGGAKGMVRGVLEGTVQAAGKMGDARALTGNGSLLLRNGKVQQFALLAAVGQLLQIEELTELDLEQAEAKYHLAGQTVILDDVILRSPNLALGATGNITFAGKVALNSTLTINDKIRGQLFRGVRENFVATSTPGEYVLPFHIGGTFEKPKTDLMQRVVGADLKDIGGVIDALFGRGKNRKPKEATPSSTAAPPSPAPTASLTAPQSPLP